ncbi:hypothetical protein MRB53_028767 [Persea americana]|uniref:Uncharacterized protein n=1 Tax=Persea americana TaxID=3435 RepID=A0ACC2KGV4_PERAE|nr:hypothetical protein MRB53_028767 [Persea americana]
MAITTSRGPCELSHLRFASHHSIHPFNCNSISLLSIVTSPPLARTPPSGAPSSSSEYCLLRLTARFRNRISFPEPISRSSSSHLPYHHQIHHLLTHVHLLHHTQNLHPKLIFYYPSSSI